MAKDLSRNVSSKSARLQKSHGTTGQSKLTKVCIKDQRPDGCASGRKLFGVPPGVSSPLEAMSVEPFIKKGEFDDNNVKELV
jgi:hypothetical protein